MKPFHYAIGFRWAEDNPDSLGFYAYGSQIFGPGDIESANNMREFIQEREGNEHKYRIFKLEEIV